MKLDMKIAGQYLEQLLYHPVNEGEVKRRTPFFYDWSPRFGYCDERYAQALQKTPGKDFVILNLADIQCHDEEAFCHVGEFYEETVTRLIEKTKPDLITLTGDNAFDAFAYMKLIEFLEGFGIPWAPVMGNADHTGLVSEFWADYRLSEAKHCLFSGGPKAMGDGNYILQIMQNGSPVHTLYMLDTHHEEEMQKGSYDHLYDAQLLWYEWAVNGIKKQYGKTVKSSVFMHIPVPEVREAWMSIVNPDTGLLMEPYCDMPFCKLHEKDGAPMFNNGFFALCKKLGSTENMIFGHDHKNCFTIPYKGINLTYAMKTGYGCYWERETNGGTVLRIGDNGDTQTEHIYINPETSEVKFFMLEYYGKNLYPTHEGN